MEHVEHVFHRRTDVAANRHVRLEHAAKLCGVAVDLGDFLVGQQPGIPQVAGAFVEAGAKEYQQVGVLGDIAIGVAVGGDAEAAQRQRRALGHHALGLEAGGDRDVEAFGERSDDVARAGLDAAVAGDNHRRVRSMQKRGEFGGGRRVPDCRLAGKMDLLEHAVVDQLLLHVVGDRQQHRPRLAPEQRLGGLVQHLAEIVGALDQLVVAGDAGEQRALVDGAAFARAFLQPALAEDVGGGLAGDRQHRQPLGVGVGDPGDEVGRARPRRGDAGSGPERHPRVAARHEGRALLVLDQHALHAGVVQAVVDRQHVRARHAEDVVDPQALQIPDDQFADGNIHVLYGVSCSAGARG